MEAEALQQGRAVFSLDLHPAYSNNALQGVLLQLQSRLLRWDDDLGGVLLAYKNLQKLPSEAPIRPYFPYLQLRVKADVLVFKPKIGQTLCGQVTKIGADYIGMTLLGTVNAAVGRQNIRSELHHNAQDNTWSSTENADSKIEVGGDVIFTVDRLRIETKGVLAVMGSLRPPWTGSTKQAARSRPQAFSDAAKWQQSHRAPSLTLAEPSALPGQADEAKAQGQPLSQAPNDVQLQAEAATEKPAEQQKKRKLSDLEQGTVSLGTDEPQAEQPVKKRKKKKDKVAPEATAQNGPVEKVAELQEADQSEAMIVEPKQPKKKRKSEKRDAKLADAAATVGSGQESVAPGLNGAAGHELVPQKNSKDAQGAKPKKKRHKDRLPNGTAKLMTAENQTTGVPEPGSVDHQTTKKSKKKKKQRDAE